jgi:hypothetical protein
MEQSTNQTGLQKQPPRTRLTHLRPSTPVTDPTRSLAFDFTHIPEDLRIFDPVRPPEMLRTIPRLSWTLTVDFKVGDDRDDQTRRGPQRRLENVAKVLEERKADAVRVREELSMQEEESS